MVAKGYLTKLLANDAVKSYIGRNEPEILTRLELVVNTVSMEEAVQQQLDSEVDEPMSDPETGAAPEASLAQSETAQITISAIRSSRRSSRYQQ